MNSRSERNESLDVDSVCGVKAFNPDPAIVGAGLARGGPRPGTGYWKHSAGLWKGTARGPTFRGTGQEFTPERRAPEWCVETTIPDRARTCKDRRPRRGSAVPGRYRPSLMVEAWVAPLLYGGGAMDDLPLLERRGVRRIFGWARVPHPATFGRWLRGSAAVPSPLLDELLWRMARRRWELAGGAPRSATIVMDSTVAVRYGLKRAGAERGYNPKKPGRPSHHPLPAHVLETGDCLGVRWRPGGAHTARGAEAWLAGLVARLRGAGVRRIAVRLDKGFFSKSIVARMEALGVSYPLKVPRHAWLGGFRGAWETAARDEAGDRELRTASGELWGTRLLSVERRRRVGPEEGELDLAAWETTMSADVPTNIEGIGPVEAWRAYNAGAVVERRIGELGQLSAGRTAVDDLGGNALLWSLAVLAYQLLHIPRANCLGGRWRAVQPRGIRLRLLRAPARITSHARRTSLRFARGEPALGLLRRVLRTIEGGLPPPAPA